MKRILSQKFKEECTSFASAAPNEDLLRELLYLVPGDDYDGCMTRFGEYRLYTMFKEFFHRLRDTGYLDEAAFKRLFDEFINEEGE